MKTELSGECVLCLSTSPWKGLWTRKQLMMRRLSERNRVMYVEPQHSLAYMLRARIGHPVSGAGLRQEEAVAVVTPPAALPAYARNEALHRLSLQLLGTFLRTCLRKVGWRPSLLWFYDPCLGRLCRTWPDAVVVYDCVDRHAAYPGRGGLVSVREKELISRAQVVTVTSHALARDFAPVRRDVHLIPNGVDTDLFSRLSPLQPGLIPAGGPRLGFVGGIGEWVDVDLLHYLAEARPNWKLCLAGPVAPAVRIRGLAEMTNVLLLGQIPREQVPAFLAGMDVCVLPFRVNSLTAAVSPLKLFEYFAAGKPVVSTALEEVRQFAPLAAVAGSKREFLQAIERFLAADDRQSDRRRLVAQRHSWSVLLPRLETIVARSFSITTST